LASLDILSVSGPRKMWRKGVPIDRFNIESFFGEKFSMYRFISLYAWKQEFDADPFMLLNIDFHFFKSLISEPSLLNRLPK
jgi:hypothetical protein